MHKICPVSSILRVYLICFFFFFFLLTLFSSVPLFDSITQCATVAVMFSFFFFFFSSCTGSDRVAADAVRPRDQARVRRHFRGAGLRGLRRLCGHPLPGRLELYGLMSGPGQKKIQKKQNTKKSIPFPHPRFVVYI
jgi:hypothetical protein